MNDKNNPNPNNDPFNYTWNGASPTTTFTNSTYDNQLTFTTSGTTTTDVQWYSVDNFINWMPYSYQKYIPACHLLKSYGIKTKSRCHRFAIVSQFLVQLGGYFALGAAFVSRCQRILQG